MRADIWHGDAGARWNDQGDTCTVTMNGVTLQAESDKALRDLYVVLGFLFGANRPGKMGG